MGIPRLSGHIRPYGVPTILSCSRPNCCLHAQTAKFVVDGPGLAHYIYFRVLEYKSSLRKTDDDVPSIDIIPSCHELGHATLVFLDELSSRGALICNIFFDGILPPDKTQIRQTRLETQLKDLRKLQSRFPNGLRSSKAPFKADPITANTLFDLSGSLPSWARGLPTPPFLVPAVLDGLSSSVYASSTSIVPAEADVFCARAAFETGCTILTGDSDLLVYDLGKTGRVSFFDQLELRMTDTLYQCRVISAILSQPSEIARRLGLDDFKYLAYQIKNDPSVGFSVNLERAKCMKTLKSVPTLRIANKTKDDTPAFVRFCKEYDTEAASNSALTLVTVNQRFLDPRLSELALTVSDPSPVYLPFLFEDPSQVSAWSVSQEIRILAYSCLFSFNDISSDSVFEYRRRGQCMNAGEIQTLSHDNVTIQASKLIFCLETIQACFPNVPKFIFWRMYALHEIYQWTFINYQTFPKTRTLSHAFGDLATDTIDWTTLHTFAQVEAVLYSIRILKQILDFSEKELPTSQSPKPPNPSKSPIPPELSTLKTILQALPPVNNLLPPPTDLKSQLPPEDLLETLFSALEITMQKDLTSYKPPNKDPSPTPPAHPKHKHKHNRNRDFSKANDRAKKARTVMDLAKYRGNIYDLLDVTSG